MAASQFGLLVVIAKLGGTAEVGRFGLALAICTPAFAFANLGLRVGKSTDLSRTFSLSDYLGLRLATTALAATTLLAAAFSGWFETRTGWVMAALILTRCVDSFSDIAYGAFQFRERMGVVGRSMILRGVGGLGVFLAAYQGFSSLPLALAAQSGFWLATLALHDWRALAAIEDTAERIAPRFERARLAALARGGLPLGVTALLVMGQASAPRIAVEHFRGTEALGYVTAAFAVFSATMLGIIAVTQAVTPRLTRLWRDGGRRRFWRLLGGLVLLSLAAGGVGLAVVAAHGDRFLAVAFRPDFAAHDSLLLVVSAAAVARFVAGMLQINLVARRLFIGFMLVHLALFVASVAASLVLVPMLGPDGAGWSLLAVSCLHLAGVAAMTVVSLGRAERPAEAA